MTAGGVKSARDGFATAVVCAFAPERFEQTLQCVASLRAQVPIAPAVIVVVDHDEPLERKLRKALEPAVRVIPNRGPRGLSGARNTGIQAAAQSTIAFIDDDATASPGWLAALQEALTDPSVVAAGGHAVPVWSGEPPRHFPEEFLWVVGCSYRGLPRSGPVRNVLGCNMAIRSNVFTEVGGFDPAIGRLGSTPLGCEETELCLRARRRFPEADVVMVEDASIEHSVPASRQRFRYFWRRCLYEGVSKALIRRLSDKRTLDTERRYAARTLGAALARDLRSVFAWREPEEAVLRIAWVTSGLTAAVVGFALGTLYYLARRPSGNPPRLAGPAHGITARPDHGLGAK